MGKIKFPGYQGWTGPRWTRPRRGL